jgi:hypothetical protein
MSRLSTLSVIPKNKKNNKIINGEIEIFILIDDLLNQVKNKLFVMNQEFIPKFTKIEIKMNNKFHSVLPNTCLYENYSTHTLEYEIYVSTLADELNFDLITEMYEKDNIFRENYLIFNQIYQDMSEEDFLFMIKYKLVENDKIFRYTNLKQDIVDYIDYNVKNFYIELIKKYTDTSYLELCKLMNTGIESDIVLDIFYTSIKLKITGNNVIIGPKGLFIKLREIFNTFELSSNIPFIALGERDAVKTGLKKPLVKVYNNLINLVSEKDIKNWILNERKKTDQLNYKLIDGLLLKLHIDGKRYLTVSISDNGIITASLETIQDSNLENITSLIKDKVDELIDLLNTYKLFYNGRYINNTKNSKVIISSVSSEIITSNLINKEKLSKLLKNENISEIISLKKTESIDTLSCTYRKISYDPNSTKKGITINIENNEYKDNSSIIRVYNANNLLQINIITVTILLLDELANLLKSNGLFQDFSKKRKLKFESDKKNLSKQGIDFDSKKCQKKKLPKLLTDSKLKKPLKSDSYIIKHNGNEFICENPDFPYPGFTNEDVVCCYIKSQIGKPNYIKNVNPESLTIFVKPSNFIIEIGNFKSYAIKIVSDYKPGLSEFNSLPRYYYINAKNILTPIYNARLLKLIENEENSNIFMDKVPLAQIIYPSTSSKCAFTPNLQDRSTLHKPCDEYPNNQFFGYTANAIPCCSDKLKNPYIQRKKKELDETKDYIISKSDKILNYRQKGILPNDLSKLFNEILDKKESQKYLKMGVSQDNNSLLNVLLLAVDNQIRNKQINNHYEFKKLLTDYLNTYPNEFKKLNGGNISTKYNNIGSFINYINSDLYLNWIDLVDLLERVLKYNIIIISISNTTKILCRPNLNKNNNPCIILLKNKNMFELIIQFTQNKEQIKEKAFITKEFPINNKVVKFLLEYYKESCIKENVYPENFNYTKLKTWQEIIEKLSPHSSTFGTIKYQIENDFNKVNMLMTSKGILLPIIETGILPDIKVSLFSSLIKQNKLLSLEIYNTIFKALSKILDVPISILGIMSSDSPGIGGILTSYNYIIPYKQLNNEPSTFKKLDIKYYLDVDTVLKNQENISTEQVDVVFEIKNKIAKDIKDDDNVKDYLRKVITSTKIEKPDKIDKIIKIFNQINISPKNENTETIFGIIANDMINDNRDQLILDNIVLSENFNKNEVKIRDSESVILNLDEIRKFFKKFRKDNYD